MLRIEDVSKHYPEAGLHLNHLNLSVQPKSVTGLVGQNGTGKSTLFKLMSGLVAPDQGRICFHGQDVATMSAAQQRQTRKKISYIFQNANLLGNKSVQYHLDLVYKLNRIQPDRQRIAELMTFMGIDHLSKTLCRHLSGGQAQKVAIAMALLSEPEILLCDEISAALDSQSEREIFDLLMQLRDQTNIAIVMIAHDLELVKALCDRVWVLEKGQIQEIQVPEQAKGLRDQMAYYDHVKEVLGA